MAEGTTVATQPLSSLPTTTTPLAYTVSSDPSTTTNEILETANTATYLRPLSPRKRRRSPQAAETPSSTSGNKASPTSKFSQPGASSHIHPPPLTAAAEMAEQKRRKLEADQKQSQQISPNPQTQALDALLGSQDNGVSRPQDGPQSAAETLSEPLAAIAPSISIPDHPQETESMRTSPVSASSLGTLGSTVTIALTANGPRVASPGQMNEEEDGGPRAQEKATAHDSEESPSHKAFSYPGPLLSAQIDARRGMSLPGSGLQRDDSRSPASNKKHKCPYCSTEFTRHHNLKSHLLTHSHEKPYLCQTCDSRFRRLHDLKRHSKLHTGERPHVCPKCKRSFARGDALARHNKAQGGCAGRRSSVGSYSGDGQHGEDSMEGMVYTDEASHEPETMDEDPDVLEDRNTQVPSIRRQDAPQNQPLRSETQPAFQRQPSTYPPVAARAPMASSLFPPTASRGGSSGSASPLAQMSPTSNYQGPPIGAHPPASTYAPQSMTESPKPLSPAKHNISANDPRNRSPSLSNQASMHNFRPRTHTRNTPPPLPPPPSHSHAPQLPSLPGLTPPDPRYTLHSQTVGPMQQQHTHHQPQQQTSGSYPSVGSGGNVPSSASNSLSSHSTNAAHGSVERGNLPFAAEDRMWAVVRALESKVERLEEEIRSLRSQLQAQHQHPPQHHS